MSMIKNRLLFISAENPFPADSGGKIRTNQMLKILSRYFNVDLITYESEKTTNNVEVPGNCRIITVPRKQISNKHLLIEAMTSIRNCSFMSRSYIDFKETLVECLSRNNYDFAFLAHSLLGRNIDIIKKQQPECKIILDAHNCESNLSYQLALSQTSLPKKLFFLLNSFFTKMDERKVSNKTDKLIVTSEPDGEAFKKLFPIVEKKITVISNFIDMDNIQVDLKEKSNDAPIIILPGSMGYFPNANGALHFYNNMYPSLKKIIPDIQWHIVGRDCPPNIEELSKNDSSIKVTGYVPSVHAYIKKAAVVIVPLLEGSGTRLKILESWALETPVVSTQIGAEGIICEDGKDIYLADDPTKFVECIVKLIRDNKHATEMANKAKLNFMSRYERKAVEGKLLKLVGM